MEKTALVFSTALSGAAISTSFCDYFSRVVKLCAIQNHPIRAGCYDLLRTHAYRMLIGALALQSMLCPIHVS